MNKTTIETDERWDLIVEPKQGLLDLHLQDLWRYRDLIMLFVRRDIIATYKQTLLGPLWFVIQPLMMTLIYTLVFGRVAQIPSAGINPPMLFFLSGVIFWNYFSSSLLKTANTFVANAGMFGKVYFPRLTVPVATVMSNLVSLLIQMVLLLVLSIYFYMAGFNIQPNVYIIAVPFLILIMSGLSLGLGIIVSALTTKYRDLTHFLAFGVQLFMFATPVVYPSSYVPSSYAWLVRWNPMAPIIESFRYACFGGEGYFDWGGIGFSVLATFVVLGIGVVLFNKVEKTFMDTV